MRKVGVSPTQWVLGQCIKVPDSVLEEESWGKLGVLQEIDAGAEFALRSIYRICAKQNFVKMDCSKRFNKTILRKAVGSSGNYTVGDSVMYRRDQKETGPKHRSVIDGRGRQESQDSKTKLYG